MFGMRFTTAVALILLACASANAQQGLITQPSQQQGSPARPDALTYSFLTLRQTLAWEPVTFRPRERETSPEASALTEPARMIGPAADFTPEKLCDALASAAAAHDLPLTFFTRLIWQESRFDPLAVSRAGAQGMAQFMPAVAAEKGLVDPFNPEQALPMSARFLGELKRQFGNVGLAAAAYNAGARRVEEWLAKRATLPRETRDYVVKITGVAPERWVKIATAAKIAAELPERLPCAFTPEATAMAAAVPLPPARPHDLPRGETVVAERTPPAPTRTAAATPASSVTKPAGRKLAANAIPARSGKARRPAGSGKTLVLAKRRLREAIKIASRETDKAAARERREVAATMHIAASEKNAGKSVAKTRKSASFAVAARDENSGLRKGQTRHAESRVGSTRKTGSAKLRVATATR